MAALAESIDEFRPIDRFRAATMVQQAAKVLTASDLEPDAIDRATSWAVERAREATAKAEAARDARKAKGEPEAGDDEPTVPGEKGEAVSVAAPK